MGSETSRSKVVNRRRQHHNRRQVSSLSRGKRKERLGTRIQELAPRAVQPHTDDLAAE
jgi:hypothetical protein